MEIGATPLAQFLVLVIATFFGGVCKGVSGFGSAIVHLFVWLACSMVGINAGPMNTVILLNPMVLLVDSLPLIIVTKAWRDADVRLVFILFITNIIGNYFGVHLLLVLERHIVELCCAALLVVLMGLFARQPAKPDPATATAGTCEPTTTNGAATSHEERNAADDGNEMMPLLAAGDPNGGIIMRHCSEDARAVGGTSPDATVVASSCRDGHETIPMLDGGAASNGAVKGQFSSSAHEPLNTQHCQAAAAAAAAAAEESGTRRASCAHVSLDMHRTAACSKALRALPNGGAVLGRQSDPLHAVVETPSGATASRADKYDRTLPNAFSCCTGGTMPSAQLFSMVDIEAPASLAPVSLLNQQHLHLQPERQQQPLQQQQQQLQQPGQLQPSQQQQQQQHALDSIMDAWVDVPLSEACTPTLPRRASQLSCQLITSSSSPPPPHTSFLPQPPSDTPAMPAAVPCASATASSEGSHGSFQQQVLRGDGTVSGHAMTGPGSPADGTPARAACDQRGPCVAGSAPRGCSETSPHIQIASGEHVQLVLQGSDEHVLLVPQGSDEHVLPTSHQQRPGCASPNTLPSGGGDESSPHGGAQPSLGTPCVLSSQSGDKPCPRFSDQPCCGALTSQHDGESVPFRQSSPPKGGTPAAALAMDSHAGLSVPHRPVLTQPCSAVPFVLHVPPTGDVEAPCALAAVSHPALGQRDDTLVPRGLRDTAFDNAEALLATPSAASSTPVQQRVEDRRGDALVPLCSRDTPPEGAEGEAPPAVPPAAAKVSRHSTTHSVVCSTVAGTLSGLMGGMTSIAGPPLMLLFLYLELDIATVRATNNMIPVLNAPSFLINYYEGGILRADEWPLYVTACATSLVGAGYGVYISRNMNFSTFRIFMLVLMGCCCLLLLVAGLGADQGNET